MNLVDERFVSLTTFRRNGTAVPTTVWVVRDGAALAVWTPAQSFKVTRVRNTPKVELAPSSRSGKVAADAAPVIGTAEVIDDPAAVDRVAGLLKRKYGFEFRVITAIERLTSRGRQQRVVVHITL